MAFTEDELAYLRTKLGSTVNEGTNPAVVEDLEDRFARLQDVKLVAVEVLRQRVADISNVLENPLQFSISGEYSQDASAALPWLLKMLAEAEQDAGVPGASTVTGISPADDRWRRNCVGSTHPDSQMYNSPYYWGR